MITRNKVRLVSLGYNQKEVIYYEETYAMVAHLEDICLLLAFVCFKDFKLFQIYVDDIIFGYTNMKLVKEFSKLLQGEFEMSLMRELTYFPGLQIKQLKEGMLVCQSKFCLELLKLFGMETTK